jgi:hypothetical protein
MRRQNVKIAVIALIASGVLLAQSTETQRMDFHSGGTLRLQKSVGLLSVDGWDQPGIEIITIKTGGSEKARDRTRVTAARRGNDIVVTTSVAQNPLPLRPFEGIRPVSLEYRIRLPRFARLNIDHRSGEVNVTDILGDIRITDGMGQIALSLPEAGEYAIDARSRLGAVDSDFPGRERKKLKYGHAFVSQSNNGAQHLYLRIGFGDITILKEPMPSLEPKAAK